MVEWDVPTALELGCLPQRGDGILPYPINCGTFYLEMKEQKPGQTIIASASQAELMNFNVPQLITNWVLWLGCEWNWRGVQEKNGPKMRDFN